MPSIKNLLKAAPKMRNSLAENINATPVPTGPLVKKKGVFKGRTLRSGGKIKKAVNTKLKRESAIKPK